MFWLLLATAWAHPFSERVAAHQTRLVLTPEVIGVEYLVDVPLSADPVTGALDVQTPSEVASGLLLLVDGVALPLAESRQPQLGADAHAFSTRVWLESPMPPDAHRLVLSTANYPDLPAWYRFETFVSPFVTVHDATPPLDAWLNAPAARTLELTFEVHTGAITTLSRRLRGTPALRPAGEPLGGTTRVVAAAAGLGALLVGLGLWGRRRLRGRPSPP